MWAPALPQKLGDLDEDGQFTVIDLARIIGHLQYSPLLPDDRSPFADLTQDGVVNESDVDFLVDIILGLRAPPDLELTRIRTTSPADNETGVAPRRETIVYFMNPLSPLALITTEHFYAEFGGRKILARVELPPDRRTATLFYLENLPGSARVRVTLRGDSIRDFLERPIDADGDGLPGGTTHFFFETLSLTPFPNTIVCGRVFASQLATNSTGSTNLSVNTPLAGVVVEADGLEQDVRAVTDQFGNFRLTNAPGGSFFVHIDGTLVRDDASGIRYPDLAYYPKVGKQWNSVIGGETNIGEIYLPLVADATLQPVNLTNATSITFPTNILAEHPELEGVSITVPPNALFRDNGTRGGSVGIAPVPADRLPGPLPDGLSFPLVITVQTDGPENFSRPVPVCFPNLTNTFTGEPPLLPGAKSGLWSFNHDTGDWEVVGSMTVSADGRLVCSDPGSGILAPGWHSTGPGNQGGGGDDCPTCDPGDDNPNQKCNPTGSCDPAGCGGGDKTNPILLYSGEKYEQVTDLRIKGVGMDFVWARSYSSKAESTTAQGNNWDFSYNIFLSQAGTSIRLGNGAGRDDTYRPDLAAPAALTTTWRRNGFSQEIVHSNDDYTMTTADQKKLSFLPFDGAPAAGKIASITDRNGNRLRFAYDGAGRLQRITDTLDRDIWLVYNPGGFIESITDFAGRVVRYTYYGPNELGGNPGDLKSVTTPAVTGTPNGNDYPNGKTTTYTYSTGFSDDRLNHNLLTITDGRGSNYLVNIYSSTIDAAAITFDRVVRQIRGGDSIELTYLPQTASPDNNQALIRVILNDQVGNVSEHFYDVGNRLVLLREYTGRANAVQPTTDTQNRPAGPLRAADPPYFETRYRYNLDYKPTRIIHPNQNITEMVYEADLTPSAPARTRMNLRLVRHLPGSHVPAGDQPELVEQYEYDTSFGCSSCGFNFVTKHTDARGNVTLSQYDDRGNLTNRIHRIPAITERWEYNPRGQMTRHVLPANGSNHRRVDAYSYHDSGPQRGYLAAETTDEGGLNLSTSYEYNAVGIVTRRIDPSGHDHQYVINALDQMVRELSPEISDGSGFRYVKDYFYDANNNLVRAEIQNRRAFVPGWSSSFSLSAFQPNGSFIASNPVWTTTYEYEILNHLVRKSEEVDPGRFIVTEYAYDGNRNRTLTRYGEATAGRQPANVVQMQYDERDLVFREFRAPNTADQSTTQHDYDGNRSRIRTWQGLEDNPRLTARSFDGYNRLASTTDAMGNVTSHNYDLNGNRVHTLVLGETNDLPGSTSNVRLGETTWTFDALDRKVRQDVAFFDTATQASIGDGLATTTTIYTDNSQVLAVINDNHHGTTNAYDTANRLSVVTDAKGNTIAYNYDLDSNVSSMVEREISDVDGHVETFTTTFGYDGLDRHISTTDNIGNLNRSSYDSRNNRTITIDANTNIIHYVYDGLNRLADTIREMTTTGVGNSAVIDTIITRQTWDDTSRLTAQIDDNTNATTYVYDALNRKNATIYADFTGQTNLFDVHHNPIRFTDANGNVVSNKHDFNNRLVRRDIIVGSIMSADTTFEIYQYDGMYRMQKGQDDDSFLQRTYDSLNNLTLETQGLSGHSNVVVACAFDGTKNLIEIAYPAGRRITATFDSLERIATIVEVENTIASYFYVGPRRVARRDGLSGVRCDYTYGGIDSGSQPADDYGVKNVIRTRHERLLGGQVLDDRFYRWDRVNNMVRNSETHSAALPTQLYTYDSAYRLQKSVLTSATGEVEVVSYTLDGVGNRVTLEGGVSQGNYTMDGSLPGPGDRQMNQYTSTPFGRSQYDRRGNLRSLGPETRVWAYDFRNRLVRETNGLGNETFRFSYDVLGRRVFQQYSGEVSEGIRSLYKDWQEIEQRAGSNVSSFVFGAVIDEVLSVRSQGNDRFYHQDTLLNVRMLSAADGTLLERYQYDSFGFTFIYAPSGARRSVSALGNRISFTGRPFDSVSGFLYSRTRYLATTLGRFMSRDTYGAWFDQVNLGNDRAYVGNNPSSMLDPFGLKAAPFTPGKDPPRIVIPGSGTGRGSTDPADMYNCHSDAWHGGQGDPNDPLNDPKYPKWDSSPADDIADAERLDPDEPNQPGDILVYVKDPDGDGKIEPEDYLHSSTVVSVDKDGNTVRVRSKDADGPVSYHHPHDPYPGWIGEHRWYRPKRKNEPPYWKWRVEDWSWQNLTDWAGK